MLLRSLGVITFIGMVGATAIYFAQRPTIARGDVLADQLMQSSKKAVPMLEGLECQPEVPIGMSGANFECTAEFKNGNRQRLVMGMDRDGRMKVVQSGDIEVVPQIKKTSDPWGD